MNFTSSDSNLINYYTTGLGNTNPLNNTNVTLLPDHTANLFVNFNPNGFFSNRNNNAMTDFPFYRGGTSHWGIRGLGNRWECDDYTGNFNYHTHHQVWVRSSSGSINVEITNALGIVLSNESSYSLSGTCSKNGEQVIINVGGISPSIQPMCVSGNWSVNNLDVSSLSNRPVLLLQITKINLVILL